MKRILTILLKVLSYIGILLAMLFFIVIIAFFIINGTNQLSPIARNFLNRNIAGTIYFENLELGFRYFPIIELHANNGHLISALNNNPTDTLARFKNLDLEIDVMRLFDDSLSIVIPKVNITDGYALVTISKDGVPGWNVWRFKKPRPKGSKPLNRERLYVSEVHLRGHNHFVYRNDVRKRSMNITSGNLDLHGSIRIRNKEIYVTNFIVKDVNAQFSLSDGKSIIKFTTPSLALSSTVDKDLRVYTLNTEIKNTFFKFQGNTFLHGSDTVAFKGVGRFNFIKGIYSADSLNIDINNQTAFKIGGLYHEYKKNVDLNIEISLHDFLKSMEDFKFNQLTLFKNLLLDIPLKINVNARGNLNFKTHTYPRFSIEVVSSGGSFNTGRYGKLYNIDLLAHSNLDMIYPDSVYIDITRLNMNYKRSFFGLQGSVSGGKSLVIADIDIDARLNLSDFSNYIIKDLGLKGQLRTKAHIKTPLNNRLISKSASIQLRDTIYIKNLFFNIPHTVASVYADDALIKLNQNAKHDFANVKFILNKAKVNSVAELNANINKVIGAADVYKNSKMIFPRLENGMLNLHDIKTVTALGDTLKLQNFISSFSSEAMLGNDPFVKYFATLNNLSLTSPDSSCVFINDIAIMSHAALYKSANFQNSRLKLWDAIGNWKYNGELLLTDAQFIMQNIPINSRIPTFDVAFNERNANLRKLHLILGDSEVLLNGTAMNWHDYILEDSLLSLDARIKSKRINLNQLIPAIIKGAAYSQSKKRAPTKKPKQNVFVAVPPNIDAKLSIEAANATYGAAMLDTASTNITLKDKHLQISDFKFRSNIVDINLDFSYFTPSADYADASVKFELQDIDASQVIQIVPKISTALPMLSTFDGMFRATVDTKWRIDSTMSINTNSVTSKISIEGRKLSVDKNRILPKFLGWLLFGKRQKIGIDSIDINVTVENNKLTLLPMKFNLGKYQLGANGVMGTNNLYYHVALLKSPIGLKLGFDVYGTVNKLKWKLAPVEGKDNKTISLSVNDQAANFMIISDKYNLKTTENKIIIDKNYSITFDSIIHRINNPSSITPQEVKEQKQKMLQRINK